MLRYAITNGTNLSGAERRWVAGGVDFVQLRAKELDAGKLLELALDIQVRLQYLPAVDGRAPKLLINGRADVAIAAGAHGVHLTAHPDELTAQQVRRLFARAGRAELVISASAHSIAEVQRAKSSGADMVLFGPVFEKRVDAVMVAEGLGLDALREACAVAGHMPVLALGGVTIEKATACIAAGAAGIAGIRLFR